MPDGGFSIFGRELMADESEHDNRATSPLLKHPTRIQGLDEITGERGDGSITKHELGEYISDCVIVPDHRVNGKLSACPAMGHSRKAHANRNPTACSIVPKQGAGQ
jgi:hypothetical protein